MAQAVLRADGLWLWAPAPMAAPSLQRKSLRISLLRACRLLSRSRRRTADIRWKTKVFQFSKDVPLKDKDSDPTDCYFNVLCSSSVPNVVLGLYQETASEISTWSSALTPPDADCRAVCVCVWHRQASEALAPCCPDGLASAKSPRPEQGCEKCSQLTHKIARNECYTLATRQLGQKGSLRLECTWPQFWGNLDEVVKTINCFFFFSFTWKLLKLGEHKSTETEAKEKGCHSHWPLCPLLPDALPGHTSRSLASPWMNEHNSLSFCTVKAGIFLCDTRQLFIKDVLCTNERLCPRGWWLRCW